MKIEIEISDDELREHILVAAGNALHKQYSTERNLYKRTIADCVREVIYKDKKEIIDRIVAQASRECGNKAAQKIVQVTDNGEEILVGRLREALKDGSTAD